jgi:hypothetical protein
MNHMDKGAACAFVLTLLMCSGVRAEVEAATALEPEPAAQASVAPAQAEVAQPGEPGIRHKSVSPLDKRVTLLTKELKLDARQQVQVRKILQEQQAQISRLWSDSSTAPALRVNATQTIGDHTADQIRAILNEEQRQKYVQEHKRTTKVGAPGADVQTWMTPAKAKK